MTAKRIAGGAGYLLSVGVVLLLGCGVAAAWAEFAFHIAVAPAWLGFLFGTAITFYAAGIAGLLAAGLYATWFESDEL